MLTLLPGQIGFYAPEILSFGETDTRIICG
jgi:hypothetical protein